MSQCARHEFYRCQIVIVKPKGKKPRFAGYLAAVSTLQTAKKTTYQRVFDDFGITRAALGGQNKSDLPDGCIPQNNGRHAGR